MKCLIVEDELPAAKVLLNHISHFHGLTIEGTYTNAMDALSILQRTPIDILFLDIQLPKMTGIQLLNSLGQKPAVIITTAFREFALDGYELEITDYLLKPISFERFAKALSKVYRSAQRSFELPNRKSEAPLFSDPFIYIKAGREYVKILLNELIYIESLKNHVKLVTTKATYITLQGISDIEQKLPQGFLRVHRSYIISLHHVLRFSADTIQVGSKAIPIGKHYKIQFQSWVSKSMV